MVRQLRIDGPPITLVFALLIGGASPLSAQPFIPAAGEGTVSLSYQWVVSRGQHTIFGDSGSPDDVADTHALIWYVEYGLNDRVAVHLSLPYIQARYRGCCPHDIGVKGQPNDIDDGTYHGSLQDLYFGTRFKLLSSTRLAVTPFVEGIVPSHHYESLGQAAVGRDLRALVVGAAIGSFADKVIPGLHFQTRLSYAFVQKAVDIRPNRTAIDSAVGYFVTPRLAIQFLETFQFTHDGIDWVGPPNFLAVHNRDVWSRDYGLNHDRLARSNALTLGAGASFALTETVGVYGAVTTLAWGQNLPAPRSVTIGMNWGFRTGWASRATPDVNRVLWLQ